MWDEGDAVDRILLAEADVAIAGAKVVSVIDDTTAALTVAVCGRPSPGASRVVRSYADSAAGVRLLDERLAAQGATAVRYDALDADLLDQAEVVLLRLPKSLAALDEIAAAVATLASPDVRLFAGGRIKHMGRGMNRVLAAHFGSVRASLGQHKSRVLMARDPIGSSPASEPRRQWHEDLSLTLCAYGGTFAGPEIDLGSRFLLGLFDRLPRTAARVVDLGCGNGVLAVVAARELPQARIVAVDDSRAAVRSTQTTAAANGLGDRIVTLHAEGLGSVEPRSVDLILCNPPFHRGTARDSTAAYAMFAGAAEVLKPGGQLWVVYNSHLPYLNALRRTVGSSTVLGQNARFTVVRSIKRDRPTPPLAATA